MKVSTLLGTKICNTVILSLLMIVFTNSQLEQNVVHWDLKVKPYLRNPFIPFRSQKPLLPFSFFVCESDALLCILSFRLRICSVSNSSYRYFKSDWLYFVVDVVSILSLLLVLTLYFIVPFQLLKKAVQKSLLVFADMANAFHLKLYG